jgi:hypothetical protein
MAGFGDIEIPRDLLFRAILKLEFQSGIKTQFGSKVEKLVPSVKAGPRPAGQRAQMSPQTNHMPKHARTFPVPALAGKVNIPAA